jgi:hypothetical protein
VETYHYCLKLIFIFLLTLWVQGIGELNDELRQCRNRVSNKNQGDEMTPEQAHQILIRVTQHPLLRLSFDEHLQVQQALQVLKPKEKEPVVSETLNNSATL